MPTSHKVSKLIYYLESGEHGMCGILDADNSRPLGQLSCIEAPDRSRLTCLTASIAYSI